MYGILADIEARTAKETKRTLDQVGGGVGAVGVRVPQWKPSLTCVHYYLYVLFFSFALRQCIVHDSVRHKSIIL